MIYRKIACACMMILIGSLGLVTNATYYKAACLKGAISGQDQKLRGHYHAGYSTRDDYRCYVAFDPQDIRLLHPRQAQRLGINSLTLPSYQAKLVYFVKSIDYYMPIITAFNQSGKSLSDLNRTIGNSPVCTSWKDALNVLHAG